MARALGFCPKCGERARATVRAYVGVKTEDGIELKPVSEYEIDELDGTESAYCNACNWDGCVSDTEA